MAVVRDVSLIDFPLAKRNGLRFFEVVITNWGLTNPAATPDIPAQKIEGLTDGTVFQLPRSVSLAGAAIGPLSSVDEVILIPEYNSFVGLNNISTQVVARALANVDGGIGSLFSSQKVVSVDHPVQDFIPGPIEIRACNRHRWRVEPDETGDGPVFIEPNIQTLQSSDGTGTFVRPQTLQLFCFIREPGPVGWPTKRAPYFDSQRFPSGAYDDTTAVGEDEAFAVWPISGRKRIHIEVWAMPPSQGVGTGSMNAFVRVILHRGDSGRGFISGAFDVQDMQQSEQIYPAMNSAPFSPPSNNIHAQEQITNDDAPNKLQIDMRDPNADWVEVRVQTDGADAVGDVQCKIRAED